MKYLVIWLILTGVISSPGEMKESHYAPSAGFWGIYTQDGQSMDYRNFVILDTQEEVDEFLARRLEQFKGTDIKYFCYRIEVEPSREHHGYPHECPACNELIKGGVYVD